MNARMKNEKEGWEGGRMGEREGGGSLQCLVHGLAHGSHSINIYQVE